MARELRALVNQAFSAGQIASDTQFRLSLVCDRGGYGKNMQGHEPLRKLGY